nr:PREDICTED: DBF4-type zinc finger-containing protein 2 [Lepisosteus oculatus]XP_015214969.1 PREDICTED: DBF4-type zinc finger-containing protein 2 [Lepisosteus oculatus]
MCDKTMPAEEQSAPSAQEVDRTQVEPLAKADRISGHSASLDLAVPGPSTAQARQGFCSCCQVLYNSLEQHILSARHRDFVSSSRSHVGSGSLMERFLQDVMQHHPYRYNDIRPTHADLPSLSTPLIPKEELSEVCGGPENDQDTVGTREELPSSDDGSSHFLLVEDGDFAEGKETEAGKGFHDKARGKAPARSSAGLCNKFKRSKLKSPFLEGSSPTQGFLHRTSDSSVPGLPHTEPCSSQAVQHGKALEKIPVKACCSFKADVRTDQLQNRSSYTPPSVHPNCVPSGSDGQPFAVLQDMAKPFGSCSQGETIHSQSKFEDEMGGHQTALTVATVKTDTKELPYFATRRDPTHSDEEDGAMEETIEEVIEKYCYGVSAGKSDVDEDSFHLSLGSITNRYFSDSGTSFEWDTPMKEAPEPLSSEAKDLGCLMKVCIDLEDPKYNTQLNCALNLRSETERSHENLKGEDTVELKEHNDDKDVLPPLPHIPQSFVGKTWSQVMHEDDLKIEALVREFREGHFRCYFDSESLAKFGRKSKTRRNKDEATRETLPKSNLVTGTAESFPLLDDEEEDCNHSTVFVPVCTRALKKKAGRRMWRLASRCQVVKVSHSTQTPTLSCPVIKTKAPTKDNELRDAKEVPNGSGWEKTPEMKTRLCALKLPETYSKIMSPVQPKTVVYVLSSPESGQCTLKPLTIRRTGRKRKSTESESALKYKYKKTPLKYYDPLTNRILKMPPKGIGVCRPKKFPHVRQLFRSLSPDINKEKQCGEQKETWSSTKGNPNSISDFCASTSGSCLDSRNEDGLSSNVRGDGPSEQGSSASSRRPAFTSKSRSSLSSSSRLILGPLTPSKAQKEGVGILPSLQSQTTETVNIVRTRATRGQAHKLSELETKSSGEKSLGPVKGPPFSYKTRKMPRRPVCEKVYRRTDSSDDNASKGQTSRLGEQKPSKRFLSRAKSKSAPRPSSKARKTSDGPKKSLRAPLATKSSPKVTKMRAQSLRTSARASVTLEEPLRSLRSSSRRTLRLRNRLTKR